MLAVRTRDFVIPGDRLRAAVRSGLEDMVGYLGGRSDSFAVPAWRKWARMLVASGPAKAWPRVFADGAGLFGALLSVWEGVEPAGMTGGNLRREFAAGLTEAAALLDEPRLGDEAARWVEIAELWHTLAEAAVPTSVPACARARELTAAVTGAVAEGDAGRADRAAAARRALGVARPLRRGAAARCRGDHRDPGHHERDPRGDLRGREGGGPTARCPPGRRYPLNRSPRADGQAPT